MRGPKRPGIFDGCCGDAALAKVMKAEVGVGRREERRPTTPKLAAALLVGIVTFFTLAPGSATAQEYDARWTRCSIEFNIRGWSFVYKTMKGTGRVTCENGQAAQVAIRTHAGGFTIGKSEIIGGRGNFSQVIDIAEVFGTYVQGEAHAGATRSSQASVMTKGEVSLAISGTGRGFDLGVALGAFTITPR